MKLVALFLFAAVCSCYGRGEISAPPLTTKCAYVLLNAEVTSCDCCGNQEPVSIKVISPVKINSCECDCYSQEKIA